MKKLKKFDKKELKREIVRKYGSIKKLKKFLKDGAKDTGYGCSMNEVTVYGCRIAYTSNPNHFAEFFISIPCVGFCNNQGLDRDSITRAGRKRGAGNHYLKF